MPRQLSLKEVQEIASSYLSAGEFRQRDSYVYKLAQEKGWLPRLQYGNSSFIILSRGWKIPNPPNNFVFNLKNYKL